MLKSVRELADLSVGKIVNITFGGSKKDKAGTKLNQSRFYLYPF
jgi:hypothetical protein